MLRSLRCNANGVDYNLATKISNLELETHLHEVLRLEVITKCSTGPTAFPLKEFEIKYHINNKLIYKFNKIKLIIVKYDVG